MSRAAPSIDTPWDDPSWTEPSDKRWQAGLRWQQAWWRHHHLRVPPGPFSRSDPERLVASTVALDADAEVNFLSAEAAAAARQRLAASGGGLVKEDRLRRVLLSSQPMCFNLFGHFQSEGLRNALLPWVRMIVPSAREVARVEVEWAPRSADHFRGGSAFDAFVEVRGVDQQFSFVGIECEYHEDLKKSDVPNVRPVYRDFTIGSGLWRDGAVTQLDIRGLRQFWLNALLAQSPPESAATPRGIASSCPVRRTRPHTRPTPRSAHNCSIRAGSYGSRGSRSSA